MFKIFFVNYIKFDGKKLLGYYFDWGYLFFSDNNGNNIDFMNIFNRARNCIKEHFSDRNETIMK